MPENADVANAIGAITSHIAVRRKLRIKPDQEGGFLIQGLPGARRFPDLAEAEAHARQELERMVRQVARASGTRRTTVEIRAEDRTARSVRGAEIFLERRVVADLVGAPDIALDPDEKCEALKESI